MRFNSKNKIKTKYDLFTFDLMNIKNGQMTEMWGPGFESQRDQNLIDTFK
jgi:hypothetical protein